MKLFLSLFLSFFCGSTFCQESGLNLFSARLAGAKVIYKAPDGFSFDTSINTFFSYIPTKHIYPLDGKIINKDSSICIGFSEYGLNLKYDTSKIFQKIYPGRKENDEYKLPIKSKADTINHKINYYSSKKSQKLFNATIAGDYYMRDFENPYEKHFYRCRIVFMHKENIGDAEIYYFYNEAEEEKVDRMIRNAYKMLCFK